MPIVYACAASHAPGIRAWAEAVEPATRDRLFAGFDEVAAGLAAAQPDVVLLLTSEHWANFFLDHIGAFCIGRGESFEGPVEPWLKVEKTRFPGNPAFAERLLNHCYAVGFEPSYSHEMKLDHGSMVPLSFIPGMDARTLVPIMFNTLATPRPTAARCLALGQALRPVLDAAPERIAVVATGGLSHDPGEINHGRIDTDFDRTFLDRMSAGRLDELAAYTDAQLLAAGAGTLELLAWICLAGIMGERKARTVAYEAVIPWATGVGVLAYEAA
ncbi:MAG: Protocatechuate 4,5-dioxygenase beta chain [Hyphomicrobiales bacterium]|nr:Protocatechuate 4,5-dioxygenase beta chain [Hyphomicrobiales bacterium]